MTVTLNHKIHALRCLDYSLEKTIKELKIILGRLDQMKKQVDDTMITLTKLSESSEM